MARKPEPKTQAVRQLIEKYGADLTWNPTEDGQPSAKMLLKELGFTENSKLDKKRITENDFNVKKHLYLRPQNERVGSPRKVAVKTNGSVALPKDSVIGTITVVNKAGGLDSYRALFASEVEKLERLQNRVTELADKVAEMEANIETFEQVQKAVA
jgi:hypothetical protein